MTEDMVVLFFVFGSLSWIAWVVVNASLRLHLSRKQAALQSRLLDILANRPDVADFMNSDAGLQFVQSLSVVPERPHARILNALQASLVLVLGGASLLIARVFVTGDTAALLVVGVAIGGTGLGFAAAAAAGYAALKRLGLLRSDG